MESWELLTFQSVGGEIILLEIVLKRKEIKSYPKFEMLMLFWWFITTKEKAVVNYIYRAHE